LAQVIEGQVIPRLIEAHSEQQALTHDAGVALQIADDAQEGFLEIVLSGSVKTMRDLLAQLEAGRSPTDFVFAGLLAPTARRVVQLWHEDRVSYADVTIAMGRLKQLARGHRDATTYNGDSDPRAAAAFFAPRPGEEQTFGLYMMEELFRWSGWRTTAEAAVSNEVILESVAGEWYDLLCLNVTRNDHLADLQDTLNLARMASRNQDLCVLVSGQVFEERPSLIDDVGADAAVSDAEDALHYFSETVGRRAAA
jgi:methanogenic corrinoid protein MtbC1